MSSEICLVPRLMLHYTVLYTLCYSMLYYAILLVFYTILYHYYTCYKARVCFVFKEAFRLSKCQSYLSFS